MDKIAEAIEIAADIMQGHRPAHREYKVAAALIKLNARFENLKEWIKSEGERTNVCTFNILGSVCEGCKCGKVSGQKMKVAAVYLTHPIGTIGSLPIIQVVQTDEGAHVSVSIPQE